MILDATTILEDAQDTILDLAYTISKKINLDLVRDEVIQGYALTSLIRVYSTGNLTAEQKLQLLNSIQTITIL